MCQRTRAHVAGGGRGGGAGGERPGAGRGRGRPGGQLQGKALTKARMITTVSHDSSSAGRSFR